MRRSTDRSARSEPARHALPHSSAAPSAQRFGRRLVEARSVVVVGRETAERSEAVGNRDRRDRTVVQPGSDELSSRHLQPQPSQMRHRRRVAEAAEGHLQRPSADPCGLGHLREPNGVCRVLLDESLGAADGGRSDRSLRGFEGPAVIVRSPTSSADASTAAMRSRTSGCSSPDDSPRRSSQSMGRRASGWRPSPWRTPEIAGIRSAPSARARSLDVRFDCQCGRLRMTGCLREDRSEQRKSLFVRLRASSCPS